MSNDLKHLGAIAKRREALPAPMSANLAEQLEAGHTDPADWRRCEQIASRFSSLSPEAKALALKDLRAVPADPEPAAEPELPPR